MCEINSLPTKLIFINKLCFSTMHRVYIAEWCIQFLLSLLLLIPIPALLSDLDCKGLLFEYWLCDRNEITEHLTKKKKTKLKYLSFFLFKPMYSQIHYYLLIFFCVIIYFIHFGKKENKNSPCNICKAMNAYEAC